MADAGKVVITPKGAYSSTATYEWLDEVAYDGKAYVALKTVTGVTPSDDGVNWRLYLDPNDIVAGNLVPTFTEASARNNIISGESLSTILGKVKKWFSDLKGHAFNDTVKNLTTEETGSALDASQGKVLQDEVEEINSNLDVLKKEIFDNTLAKDLFTTKGNTLYRYLDVNGNLNQGSADYSVSDFIAIKGGKTYRIVNENQVSLCCCFYDISKTFVSSTTATNKDIFVANNVAYIRFTYLTNNSESTHLYSHDVGKEVTNIKNDLYFSKTYTNENTSADVVNNAPIGISTSKSWDYLSDFPDEYKTSGFWSYIVIKPIDDLRYCKIIAIKRGTCIMGDFGSDYAINWGKVTLS